MSITLIKGPMFGGKTTAMIGHISRYQFGHRIETVTISHSMDDRYQSLTHDGQSSKSEYHVKLSSLSEMPADILDKVGAIGIDEGQFFDDLIKYSLLWVSQGKHIIISALSGDYLQRPFPIISELEPHCDQILFYPAVCAHVLSCGKVCGKVAPFTIKLTATSELIEVGGSDKYCPVCREHISQVSPDLAMATGSVSDQLSKLTSKSSDTS